MFKVGGESTKETFKYNTTIPKEFMKIYKLEIVLIELSWIYKHLSVFCSI